MQKIVKLQNCTEFVLIDEREYEELIYFGEDTVYKISKELDDKVIEALNENDDGIYNEESMQNFLQEYEDIKVEVCDTYEESQNQIVLWKHYEWIQTNLDTYETDPYYCYWDGHNWKKELIEEIIIDKYLTLETKSLNEWYNGNFEFNNSGRRAYLHKFEGKFIIEYPALYQHDYATIKICNNEEDLLNWAIENDYFDIWNYVDLEVESLKNSLEEILLIIDRRFAISKKRGIFKCNQDAIYTDLSDNKISLDPFVVVEYKKQMGIVSNLYRKIRNSEPGFIIQ